jgi:hypothetical protein
VRGGSSIKLTETLTGHDSGGACLMTTPFLLIKVTGRRMEEGIKRFVIEKEHK